MKQIKISATLRIEVPSDMSEQDVAKLALAISSDTIPTLENIKSEVVSQLDEVTGSYELGLGVADCSVWVDDIFEVYED